MTLTRIEQLEQAIQVIEDTPAEQIGRGAYYHEDIDAAKGPCCAIGHIHAKGNPDGLGIPALEWVLHGGSYFPYEGALERRIQRINDTSLPGEPRKAAVLDRLRELLAEAKEAA